MENNFMIAITLTVLAGLSTGIGSIIGLIAKKTNTKFLSVALGFSAGVMLFVSFVDIYPKANDMLLNQLNENLSGWLTMIGFFTGIVVIAIVDSLLPKDTNNHNDIIENINNEKIKDPKNTKALLRMGIFTALAIGIHNFPEGLATFMATLADPSLGVPIAVAIALHNIPEGLAVSVPIYYATGSRKKAFFYSFLSGIAEPVGALIGYIILRPFLNDIVMGMIFSAVGGIMIYISLDELLPAAKRYGKPAIAKIGLVLGMLVMAISLQLL